MTPIRPPFSMCPYCQRCLEVVYESFSPWAVVRSMKWEDEAGMGCARCIGYSRRFHLKDLK